MKLFNLLDKEKRDVNAKPAYSPFADGALFFGRYTNGSAMSLSTVFAAVDIISNSLAELPIQVKSLEDGFNSVQDTHNIVKLFNNGIINKFNLMKQLMVDMLLYGNGFAYIRRDRQGEPIELVYLQHGSVTIDWQYSTQVLRYKVNGYRNVPNSVKPEDMLHFYKNSNDGVQGRGILSYANRTIEIGNYTEEAAKDYFGSGCGIKGILKFNEQVLDLDKDEIRKNWQQVHGGSDGSGLAVCDYNCDFIPVSQNAKESQMIESRLFNVTDVARFFGISPVLLQDLSHSSYSTIEASQLEFLTHTLLPYISLIENELNKKIGSDDILIDLNENYLMITDKTNLSNYLKSLKDAGIISINEARKQLGYGSVDGGDKLMVNYTKIEDNIIAETKEE